MHNTVAREPVSRVNCSEVSLEIEGDPACDSSRTRHMAANSVALSSPLSTCIAALGTGSR